MKEELKKHISQLEEILIEFRISEEKAQSLLADFLGELKNEKTDSESAYGVCIYNVLATINSVPCLTKKSAQLMNALMEAKEEMSIISEIL
ncbi:MAG: hypothetical protein IKA17_04210 [Clostridia bacterium]|nr:hypothetical protein [Clostridia bacterium]